jgi:predicted phage terminase large subunit-like protein
VQALASIRRDVGSLVWAAEYQGAPTAAEGTLVKRQWLPIVNAAPSQVLGRVRYWDKAASSKATAKYTAGVRVAYSADGLVYVEDVKRGQWSTGDRRAIMRQTAQMDGIETVIGVEQEPGSSGLDSVQDDIRLMVGFAVFADRPSGDKDTRLLPFAAQAEAGNVRLVAGSWNEQFIDELCAIPNGRYRDQADAVAAGFNRLIELINTTAGVVIVDEAVEISPY